MTMPPDHTQTGYLSIESTLSWAPRSKEFLQPLVLHPGRPRRLILPVRQVHAVHL